MQRVAEEDEAIDGETGSGQVRRHATAERLAADEHLGGAVFRADLVDDTAEASFKDRCSIRCPSTSLFVREVEANGEEPTIRQPLVESDQ
jgi:hypothetical protein